MLASSTSMVTVGGGSSATVAVGVVVAGCIETGGAFPYGGCPPSARFPPSPLTTYWPLSGTALMTSSLAGKNGTLARWPPTISQTVPSLLRTKTPSGSNGWADRVLDPCPSQNASTASASRPAHLGIRILHLLHTGRMSWLRRSPSDHGAAF